MDECDNGKYKVIFLGPAARDFSVVDGLVKKLQVELALSRQSIAKIMYVAPIVFKKEVDLNQAQRLKAYLEEMGAAAKIEPMDGVGVQTNEKTSEETMSTRKWAETMRAWKCRERIPIRESHTSS